MPETTELKFTPIEGKEEQDILNKYFVNVYRKGFVRCEGTVMPDLFQKYAQEILKFEVYDDDVWVCSFPKTGTTWTQEMVWCIANNVDFETAKVELDVRFPFIEAIALFDIEKEYSSNPELTIPKFFRESINCAREMPRPRFIKTHLPFHLLPLQLQQGTTKAKIVYVSRNVKDTIISYHNHARVIDGNKASLEEIATLFIKDAGIYTPFWGNVLGYWEKRHNKNMLFLKYEEMKQDIPSVIRRTANFLEKTLTENQIEELCHHLSFEEMKNNDAVNGEELAELNRKLNPEASDGQVVVRCGEVGQWKTSFSPEWIEKLDEWTEENLKGSELTL